MSSPRSFAPERFRRHTFVWCEPGSAVFQSAETDPAILREWLENGRPLIVRRPCLSPDRQSVCAALALPPSAGKLRLACSLPLPAARQLADPPLWEECAPDAEGALAATLDEIRTAADAARSPVRTFGSRAWQHLTGLPYVTPSSDFDLLVFLESRTAWNAFRQRLGTLPHGIDLEIVLSGDSSFSWREFASTGSRLLFKGNSRVWMGEKNDVERLVVVD